MKCPLTIIENVAFLILASRQLGSVVVVAIDEEGSGEVSRKLVPFNPVECINEAEILISFDQIENEVVEMFYDQDPFFAEGLWRMLYDALKNPQTFLHPMQESVSEMFNLAKLCPGSEVLCFFRRG